jgi:hypothetical protein
MGGFPLLPESLRSAPGARLFAERGLQVAGHEAAGRRLDHLSDQADAPRDLVIGAVCALELAHRMSSAAQETLSSSRSVWLSLPRQCMFITCPLLARGTDEQLKVLPQKPSRPSRGNTWHMSTLHPPASPTEADIQHYFRVTPPSVHQRVLTLERGGFIRRQPGALAVSKSSSIRNTVGALNCKTRVAMAALARRGASPGNVAHVFNWL